MFGHGKYVHSHSVGLLCVLVLWTHRHARCQGSGLASAQDWLTSSGLWSRNGPMDRIIASSTSCEEVRDAILRVLGSHGQQSNLAANQFMERIREFVEHLDQDGGPPYPELWQDVAGSAEHALNSMQMLSLITMVRKDCFSSAARLELSRALLPLQTALQQQVSTMWWMFDIGQYSNTNSPVKHLDALLKCVRHVEAMFEHLFSLLPDALSRSDHFWGHASHGMFMNSTVIYRKLFPKSAIVDKGLLRSLLRIFDYGSTVGDFGALDGQYSRWMNDTGWVSMFAFDGVEGVADLTDGAVSQVDLANHFVIPWRREPFDWILCLEVAEHIPPENEAAFLDNLRRHASRGLILSWAPPGIEGEGHVNCLPLEESRRRLESIGFTQDVEATARLRSVSEIPWIAASVAVYRSGGASSSSSLS